MAGHSAASGGIRSRVTSQGLDREVTEARLDWNVGPYDDSDPGVEGWASPNSRIYRLYLNGDGKWKVTVAVLGGENLARGWARTPDAARRIAQEWEDMFVRHEYGPNYPAEWDQP